MAVAGKVASDLLKTLADILKSTNQTNVALALLGLSFAARRARIVGAADTNTWYPNTIELPMDAFVAHVDTCIDLAYGAPSGLIGSIDALLAGITVPAPAQS